ncbi:uncharacterized protein LOC110093127 [Dendrobium catenatum]|uniref:Rubredoxin-like domain-containing protein n=1 Tax=Dendrobium catenatum TaxID=906689 RepID=A0A2I0VKZ7_9ASPA|nr:uncharacterized protein LOC110093127 [Dendrobium catenatum]PKU64086.1 hypothetical protein MA16_Dca007992 [Dendrobium catenatum]
MALATAIPNFSIQGLSNLPPPKTFISQSPIVFRNLRTPTFSSPFYSIHKPQIHLHNALFSVDLSKDDKPLSNDPLSQSDPAATDYKENVEEKFDRRRLDERLAVMNTGIYECRSCGYRYDEAVGDPSYPIPPGFRFEKLPEDWRCSTCGAAKSFFESKSVEIAGFEQNQNFGFGANTLTGGQKALLIYGSLLLAFALFLSGYFLQ